MLEYNKRLTEVDEILCHLSEDDLMKIPEDVKQFIKENKDKEYIWIYDEEKTLKDQDINRDTIAILSYLNMEYLLTQEQKELMEVIHDLNEQEKRRQDEISDKEYNNEDMFKRNQDIENKEEQKNEEKIAIAKVNKDNFLKKIINKIKSIFKK